MDKSKVVLVRKNTHIHRVELVEKRGVLTAEPSYTYDKDMRQGELDSRGWCGRKALSSKDFAEVLDDRYARWKVEVFRLLLLDEGKRVIGKVNIKRGGKNNVSFYHEQALRPAIEAEACFVVFSHNHPGGEMGISNEDICLTKELCATFEEAGIHVLDHIIMMSNGEFISFKDMDMMPTEYEIIDSLD